MFFEIRRYLSKSANISALNAATILRFANAPSS